MSFNKFIFYKDAISKFIVISQLLIYLIIMLLLYCNIFATVPDEVWFLNVINTQTLKTFKDYIFIQNFLGYGSFYWTFLALIKNLFCLRLIAWFCIAIVPFTIIFIQRKLLNISWINIVFANFLYLSMPCVWFTGKIIGPEIYSNTIGVISTALFLLFINKKNTSIKNIILLFVVFVFIGISSGIKAYNVSFGIFSISFFILNCIKNKFSCFFMLKRIVLFLIGFINGFLLSNLIIFKSLDTFITNFTKYSSPFNITQISTVLLKKHIEWDLVNSSGLEYFIIPCFILFLLYLISLIDNKNNNITISSIISTIFLLLLCSRDRFLGWYLMPLTFFIPLAIPIKKNYYFISLTMVNLFIMAPFINFQVQTKIETIHNIKNQHIYKNITNKYNKIYNDYQPIYIIDLGLNSLPYSHFEPPFFDTKKKSILYFTEHSLKNLQHRNIVEKSQNENAQYKYVTKEHDITIILYIPHLKRKD